MKLLFLLIYSITFLFITPLHAADNEALLSELKKHKARSLSTWLELAGKDIKDRILPAPDIIIDYLRKDKQFQGYEERPRKPEIDAEFFSDIVRAIVELPESVRSHFREHVVAVFLVEELGGTAYGELLRDFGNNKLGFIVLDVGSLNRKANEWISWRANSPFATQGTYIIEAEIEPKSNDYRKAAIQYILIHEVGHLVGVAKEAHPDWFRGGHPQKWPFTKLSWLTWERGLKGKSKFDKTFINRSKLKFYAFKDAPLTSKEIDLTYSQLSKTDFVSLYAATNMYDDFAETYAMYVHVVLQNRPWKLRIMKDGETVREIANPILDKRCESKRVYIDRLFTP
ncbi:MAG: hypothetical protein H8E17_06305 [Deltaproteobacteria bacterium]|nr:hypothetical protein [Deltaproteobacteria bacterium]